MIELTEKSAQYAAEKSNEVIANALARAYEDGYRDGYKDREEEIPVDLRDNKTEYVDLGLSSGTLWSSSYEKIGEERLYIPYDQARVMNIPTENQWIELLVECRWSIKTAEKIYCIGPNGNSILFENTGYITVKKKKEIEDWSFFLD